MDTAMLLNLLYVVAAGLFIYGLKLLSALDSARRGNLVSALGMAIAVGATLTDPRLQEYLWLVLAGLLGSGIGAFAALRVKMTAMPQMVALFNGFGGAASLLVAAAEYFHRIGTAETLGIGQVAAIGLAVGIGGVTFSGSLIAFGKLAEILPGRPLALPGQIYFTGLLLLATLAAIVGMGSGMEIAGMASSDVLWLIAALALVLGLALVLPIGGADMPVVISLLNSYSGLAACAAGFVILNNLLIVAGALVGASGMILTGVMCRGMNRSLPNVLFGGVGGSSGKTAAAAEGGEVRAVQVRDAWQMLEAAQSVVIVPGYGMAVAQAQHAVCELCSLLEKNGAEVRYAIHPVAGRMPGHMNVLLAEANVPYEQLVEPGEVNPIMESVDLCIVVGANDVVNPAAREQENSPIYGMPIIEAERARIVFVLKRSMASGFAGVDNPLFFRPNTRMLFGDARETLTAVAAEFKS